MSRLESSARKIRAWLVLKGIRQVEVARDLEISPATVGKFIDGHSKSKRLGDYLIGRGCPAAYLSGRM